MDPRDEREAEAAQERFLLAGNPIFGFAVGQDWPEGHQPAWLAPMKFVSTANEPPPGVRGFPVRLPSDLEAAEASASLRPWDEAMKAALRTQENEAFETLVLHPMVLAKHDPNLRLIQGIAETALQAGWAIRTLRDVVGK